MKQFKIFLLFVVIFTTVTAKIQQPATCPLICNCTQISDQCTICIEKQFFRNFNATDKTCPCLSGYSQNYPPSNICCAKNCSSCYSQGCFQCRKNWTKILNVGNYICTCKTYYVYDPQLNDCVCLANIYDLQNQFNQVNYYSPSRFQCYRCGIGCKCDVSGCYRCDVDTNRQIKLTTSNVWSCLCQNGYIENYNGICVKQILDLNCTDNRILVNNKCVCTEPFYQFGDSCQCKSNLNPTSYYMYRGVCYICPTLCKCNQFGCVHCSLQAKRVINQNNCSCFKNKGVIQVDGLCICISPYDPLCICNSYHYPQLFVQNITTKKCFKCPNGCICNQNQISCDPSSKRYPNGSSGKCIPPYIQLDGQCTGCPDNFIYINKTCVCPSVLNLQNKYYLLLYYDASKLTCNNCPVGCTCDATGCIRCNQPLNRIITKNKYGIFTCYCDSSKKLYQNSLGLCECISPYTYDSTGNCLCQEPYFLNGTNNCICKSYQNSTGYYMTQSGCKPCPIQCNCSVSGCYECSQKTGRAIIKQNYTVYYFLCPCFPIEFIQTNGYCKQCLQSQYLWKNQCINCDYNCQTCDQQGCLTCVQSSMKLLNKKCYCWDTELYNGNNCLCPKGNFLDIINIKCLPCPVYCQNCYLNLVLSGMIECIQCNIDLFRKNDTENNCPCIDYYVQGPIKYEYCCHWSCKDCNISGCVSCLPFTLRELNNSNPNNLTCSCKSGFVENYSTFCSCPKGTYQYLDQCLSCPRYCSECMIFIVQIISCTVCADGYNRILSDLQINFLGNLIKDCVCEQRYFPVENSSYCYPIGCIQMSSNGICKKCEVNRTLSSQGKHCNCSVGFYVDSYYNCKTCSFNCIQCISFDICTTCNTSNNSYLVMNKEIMQIKCIIPDGNKTILVQNSDNFILQFMNPYFLTQEMQIYLILLIPNVSINTIKLNIIQFRSISMDFFMIKFNNLFQNQLNAFLIYINTTYSDFQNYFLIKEEIYMKQTLNYPYMQSIFIRIFIVFVMITSLSLNIFDQKSNQLVYYCQTIYFVAMNVKDSHMHVVPFLNYFRITIFNFSPYDSGSPFNDLIADWIVFIEHCTGNYKYFSIDNNLIRNAGLALYLSIQTIFFSIIFRIIYYFLYDSKYKTFIKKYKKVVYRSIEWMYKVTMYPLIFYSLSTLINYKDQYSLVNQQFRYLCLRLSIFILISYTVITFIQITYQDISKMYKYITLIQYVFNIINSIIIVYSVYNQLIFILIFSMLLKSIMLYIIFRLYTRWFSSLFYYINIFHILQCSVIIAIYLNNKISTIILILSYVFGLTVMRILLIRMKYLHYKYDKKVVIQEQNKEMKSESKFISETNNISQSKSGDDKFISTINVNVVNVL